MSDTLTSYFSSLFI